MCWLGLSKRPRVGTSISGNGEDLSLIGSMLPSRNLCEHVSHLGHFGLVAWSVGRSPC